MATSARCREPTGLARNVGKHTESVQGDAFSTAGIGRDDHYNAESGELFTASSADDESFDA